VAAFSYSAINANGLELTGELHAPDLAGAREQLRVRGLLANTLNELAASGDDTARNVFKKVKPKTLQIFSRQFATMIEAGLNVVAAGVDIIKALEITGQTAGNWVVEDALAGVRQKVGEGVPIATPLLENEVFPPMVSQMVKIGEETGELEKMLGKIADFYEDEVDASVQSLTSIIEPLMMIGVGIMVGIIIISMYLPMFKMLSLVK